MRITVLHAFELGECVHNYIIHNYTGIILYVRMYIAHRLHLNESHSRVCSCPVGRKPSASRTRAHARAATEGGERSEGGRPGVSVKIRIVLNASVHQLTVKLPNLLSLCLYCRKIVFEVHIDILKSTYIKVVFSFVMERNWDTIFSVSRFQILILPSKLPVAR